MVRRCWVNFQCRGVILIWITVGQGPIVLAVGAGGGCLDIFILIYPFSPLSPSFWETARHRLKYCLKGPLNPKTTNPSPYLCAKKLSRTSCACSRGGSLFLPYPIQPHPLSPGGGRVVRRCWVNFQCWGVLLTWITVGQGSIVLAVGAGGGCLDIFTLICPFFPLSPSLWETARYRLKYCLKGPLNTKPTNQPTFKSPYCKAENDIS